GTGTRRPDGSLASRHPSITRGVSSANRCALRCSSIVAYGVARDTHRPDPSRTGEVTSEVSASTPRIRLNETAHALPQGRGHRNWSRAEVEPAPGLSVATVAGDSGPGHRPTRLELHPIVVGEAGASGVPARHVESAWAGRHRPGQTGHAERHV